MRRGATAHAFARAHRSRVPARPRPAGEQDWCAGSGELCGCARRPGYVARELALDQPSLGRHPRQRSHRGCNLSAGNVGARLDCHLDWRPARGNPTQR